MFDPSVYLVTQQSHSAGRSTPAIVRAAIEGGVDCIQLREKHTTARHRYELGRELRAMTAGTDIPLIVNDRVDLAQAIEADGVHLGDEDLPVAVAREQLGTEAIIGRSVTTPAEAEAATAAGADYLGVGAVYRTDSKDVAAEEEGIGPEGIAAVRSVTDLPIIAIGGITPDNAAEVIEAGADGVAVISAITQATDPGSATSDLRAVVTTAAGD